VLDYHFPYQISSLSYHEQTSLLLSIPPLTATNKRPSQLKIYRAERTATPPAPEKGDGIEGVNASGGGSRGLGTGQGQHGNDPNKPPLVD